MCEFCLKHGEGKKWYLEANNYSEDLLSDLRRKRFIQNFFKSMESTGSHLERRIDHFQRYPRLVKRAIRWNSIRTMKKLHYGQVIPLEEVERIFGFVNSIVRVACICRHIKLGDEKRYCYGISMGPGGGKLAEILDGMDQSFLTGPDTKGLEIVDKQEAMAHFSEYETEGLCHTVWTFRTPFIGGICNCDRSDCLAMNMTVTHDIPVMFRAEYVAENDPDLCKGCRQCMRVCQFGAIAYSAANKKTFIDPRRCFGCGICRAVCKKDAIQIKDRAQVAIAADIW